jgi:demethylmenaquinone methyltransferase/2-methoxy-6-polyprenyl-1,4-benzoquinol methylase
MTVTTPVPKSETPAMFSEIAPRYDLLNHVLSFNIDRLWRRKLVRMAALPDRGHALDACTGTGDVAIGFARAHKKATICGVDRSNGMLGVGRQKVARKNLTDRITFYNGDVLALPFATGAFDAVTIAFGLRNLPDYAAGVAEMTRVLKPGGRLLVLDFAPPEGGLYLRGYRFYLENILPVVGGIVSGSRRAYRYLSGSIEGFFSPQEALDVMRRAGLEELDATKLSGGVAYIYRGVKTP